MYYAFIRNGIIDGKGECQQLGDVINFEISEEVYNSLDRYMWNGEAVVENPNYQPDHSEEIAELKAYLGSTDYVIIKLAESTDESEKQEMLAKYDEIIIKRKEARQKINKLDK